MVGHNQHEVVDLIENRFRERTKRSRQHHLAAKNYLPGGDTRTTTYFAPYPIYMEKGEGCLLYDCDGNEYLDLLNNYSSLIRGHAHPATVEAARRQLESGSAYGAAAKVQYLHAQHLCRRVDSLETIRYCNSGTEATMFAIRAARAFTGKDGLVKMDGGYHGSHDLAKVNLNPDLPTEGLPRAQVEAGVPKSVLADAFIVPFNDLDALETVLQKNQDRLAAVITEPVMGAAGVIPPKPGYLKGVRELADRYNVLLILDEIITFRLSAGGFQQIGALKPDLTTLGKMIGGGLPVGAFGGRRDIMALFDPASPKALMHGGTFNGNNITLAAGLATLEAYDQQAADRLNRLGDRLKDGFDRAFKDNGLRGCVSGVGSVRQVSWQEETPLNAKESATGQASGGELSRLLHLELINRGVYSAARGMLSLATPMREGEIDRAIKAFHESLDLLRPYVVEKAPHLLAG